MEFTQRTNWHRQFIKVYPRPRDINPVSSRLAPRPLQALTIQRRIVTSRPSFSSGAISQRAEKECPSAPG